VRHQRTAGVYNMPDRYDHKNKNKNLFNYYHVKHDRVKYTYFLTRHIRLNRNSVHAKQLKHIELYSSIYMGDGGGGGKNTLK
jgi:hypothetical protein